MKNLILLGAPGSGKGTQSKNLVETCGYVHISTGNLLRDEVKKGSDLGNKVKAILEKGDLVSDEIVIELIKSNIDLTSSHYIFDGFPRNVHQAEVLDEQILGEAEYQAVYFDINTDRLVERLTNRRVTSDGKYIYNLITNPPKVAGVCDVTGQQLIHRNDDKEEVIRTRMDVFESTIQPMLDYYSAKDRLVKIQADSPANEVFEEIKKYI